MVDGKGRVPDGKQLFEEMLAFEMKHQQVLRGELVRLIRQRVNTTIGIARELGENEAVVRAMLLQLYRENVVSRTPVDASDDAAVWGAEAGQA